VTGFLPEGKAGTALREEAVVVQQSVRSLLDWKSLPPDMRAMWEMMIHALCKHIENLIANGEIDEEQIEIIEDLKKLIDDPRLLFKALGLFLSIVDDLDIDKDDSDNIKALKETLKEMAKDTTEGGIVKENMRHIVRLLCDLAAFLDSDELVSIELDIEDDKVVVRVDVEEEIEIRWAELLDIDTETSYGKTNIYLDVHIKEDTTIRFCDDGLDDMGKEKSTIMFDPPDGIDLDFDSSGIFLVDYIEERLGDINLDKICVHSIRFENCMVIFEGESLGKTVKVKMAADAFDEGEVGETASGLTIEVDGEQVFPQ
jgi:hypothetical protein